VMTLLSILGGLLALAFGLWLGSAGEYRPDEKEIEEAFDGGRPRRQARRHYTFLNAFINRKTPASARRRHRGPRSPFSQD
jgi:hypothetical protein